MVHKTKVLIIYDISDDKRRRNIVKMLNGFGNRIQFSAFEANLSENNYNKLLLNLKKIENNEDSIIVYKMNNQTEIMEFGNEREISNITEENLFF